MSVDRHSQREQGKKRNIAPTQSPKRSKKAHGHVSVRSFVLVLAAAFIGLGAGVLMWLSHANTPAAMATGIAVAAASFEYLDKFVSDA